MSKLSDLFDEYSFKARLIPAFLVLLPIAIAAWAWLQDFSPSWKLLGEIIVYCGGTFLLAQLGRDLGRRKEKDLFSAWGGKPTTRILRHRQSTLDGITLNRYHQKLGGMLSIEFPSKELEVADKKKADELYEAAVRVLLERTRDKGQFPLVFKENVNYGFRRNLWGMKPAAIAICSLSLLAGFAPVVLAASGGMPIPPTGIISTVCNAVLLTWWIVRITPGWVRLPAEAYALRLLASSEQL